MKTRLALAALAVALAWNAAPAAAQMEHAIKPSVGFAQLTPLVGEWEGQNSAGKAVQVSYQLVSNGTALLERLQMGGESEMVTVYTADGDRLAVTHFCSAGNQPQMSTEPIMGDTKQFSFSFVRGTNLATTSTGHMHHLTLNVQDHNHLAQEWTWAESGKTHAEVFNFTRKS